MGYLDVFNDIVEIMHEDYSGCLDKKGWDHPEYYKERLGSLDQSHRLTRYAFEELVQSYLNDFKDEHNVLVSTHKQKLNKTVGFRVRRYRDKLIVDKTVEEKRLQKGTVIFSVDNHSIPVIAEEYRHLLRAEDPDRQYWDTVLLKAFTCEVKHPDGSIEVFRLAHYDQKPEVSNYSFNLVNNMIPMITVNDFRDREQMQQLIEAHHETISTSQALIIDVRECQGGSDSVYLPLLNYLFQPNPTINSDDIFHHMTERNYYNRMNSFKKFNQNNEDPFIAAFIKEMHKHRNKGFVEFDLSDFDNQVTILGSEHPQLVIILIDKYCGSSGEQFVIDASQSDKVIMIGRPTRGVIDYSNQAVQTYEAEGYEFRYATSKSQRVNEGQGIDGKGVQPNIINSWSLEHVKRDIDLDVALETIKKQRVSKA